MPVREYCKSREYTLAVAETVRETLGRKSDWRGSRSLRDKRYWREHTVRAGVQHKEKFRLTSFWLELASP